MTASTPGIDLCYRPRPRALLVAGLLLLASAGLASGLGWSWPRLLLGVLVGAGVGCLLGALLHHQLPDARDATTPALRRRYLREFLPPMGAYVVLVLVSSALLDHVEATWLRAPVALLPLPALAWAMRGYVRYVRDADELQRRIELEAVSLATLAVSLLYLGAGFLQSAKVIDLRAATALVWLFPLLCVSYSLAKIAVARRFR